MTQYIWRVRSRLPERYLSRCKVLARGRMNTCLVEFEDGYRVITSRNYLMKLETWQKRMAKFGCLLRYVKTQTLASSPLARTTMLLESKPPSFLLLKVVDPGYTPL